MENFIFCAVQIRYEVASDTHRFNSQIWFTLLALILHESGLIFVFCYLLTNHAEKGSLGVQILVLYWFTIDDIA